tara:strand:+ start:97 stop:840 length:744 start_codon:yes stop_codon:yes gene_type:complete
MKGFAYYKNSIDSILENSYKDKNKFKKNLSVIMGSMKYSKTLSEFFILYNDVASKRLTETKDSEVYITETTTYLREKKDKLNKVLPVLDKIISSRKEICENRVNEIYDNLDNIIFNDSIKNIESIIESKKILTKNMLKEEGEKLGKTINPKVLSHVLSKNYGKAYNEKLSESQKEILKNTILMTESNLENEFTNIKDIVLTKLNSLIKESKDDNLIVKLVETKNKITTLKTSKKSYIQVRGLLEDLN